MAVGYPHLGALYAAVLGHLSVSLVRRSALRVSLAVIFLSVSQV